MRIVDRMRFWKHERESDTDLFENVSSRLGRLPTLVRREQLKLTSPVLSRLSLGPIRVPHCLIGLLLVPLLFALSVAVSVPTDPDRDVSDGIYGEMAPIARLGFLAVVSVIWMSASGSHLSITRQRELYDYEKSHGLSWLGILSAKTSVLVIAGLIQTLVFALWLYFIRDVWLERSFFVSERGTQLVGVVLCLLAVSVAATMSGLLISAIAGRSPLVATAILPVVMMFQILFSAPFAVSSPDGYEPLADYDRLTVFAGEGAEEDEWEEDEWEDGGFWEDDEMQQKPLWATSLLSYATLSRYGDKWIRSFAVTIDPPDDARKVQWQSAGALACGATFCFFASWFLLWMQSTRLGIRRATSVATKLVMMSALFAAAIAGQPCHAQTAADDESIVIRLPLVEGRYDENKFRAAMGGKVEDVPRWREFGNQDRIGLVALELLGKIQFNLSDDELSITLNSQPRWDLVKQLAPPRLIGADDVGDAEEVILFVHGLEGSGDTFAKAAKYLSQRGIVSMHFDFPNDGPPDEIGELLSQALIDWQKQHPGARVHLVAHSLGGLISTWAVTGGEVTADLVPNVCTFGTPFRGSALAAFHDELELFDVVYRLATFKPGALDTITDGRGEAAVALQPGSDFLRRLHQRQRPAGMRFHLAAGTKSFLTDSRRDRLVAALPGEMSRLRISSTYAKRVERLAETEELRDGLGDGAVTVESALGLPNASTQTTFSLSHTALVSSEGPLEWVLERVGLADPAKQLAK